MSSQSEPAAGAPGSTLTLSLGPFARTQLHEEAARQQATAEELAAFAVLYYLADVDSGRVSRELPPR